MSQDARRVDHIPGSFLVSESGCLIVGVDPQFAQLSVDRVELPLAEFLDGPLQLSSAGSGLPNQRF
jgi:hypothetical protein